MQDGFGFGYLRKSDGFLVRKKNSKMLVLGDNVEIGKYTVLDCGSYRNTVVGDGTKIDNLVHIGHNVIIGKNCLIVAGTVVGGSVEIGDSCYIGMNVSIRDHVKIGKHVLIGAGSVVLRDVPDYDIVAGNPAISIKNRVNLSPLERFQMVGY